MNNLEIVSLLSALYVVGLLCAMVCRLCLLWREFVWTLLAAFWMVMAIMLFVMASLLVVQERW